MIAPKRMEVITTCRIPKTEIPTSDIIMHFQQQFLSKLVSEENYKLMLLKFNEARGDRLYKAMFQVLDTGRKSIYIGVMFSLVDKMPVFDTFVESKHKHIVFNALGLDDYKGMINCPEFGDSVKEQFLNFAKHLNDKRIAKRPDAKDNLINRAIKKTVMAHNDRIGDGMKLKDIEVNEGRRKSSDLFDYTFLINNRNSKAFNDDKNEHYNYIPSYDFNNFADSQFFSTPAKSGFIDNSKLRKAERNEEALNTGESKVEDENYLTENLKRFRDADAISKGGLFEIKPANTISSSLKTLIKSLLRNVWGLYYNSDSSSSNQHQENSHTNIPSNNRLQIKIGPGIDNSSDYLSNNNNGHAYSSIIHMNDPRP